MTEPIKIALIVGVGPTLMGAAALIHSVRSKKVIRGDVREVHLAMNSRLTEMIELVRKASFAEGVKSELDKRIDRLAGDG